jgi:hypothetical protein
MTRKGPAFWSRRGNRRIRRNGETKGEGERRKRVRYREKIGMELRKRRGEEGRSRKNGPTCIQTDKSTKETSSS